MPKMTVYHGGYMPVREPEIRIGRNTKDFVYDVRLNTKLNIKEFSTMTEEWLDFIVACRNGQPHSYDIVIGAMADDQIYSYISDFIDGSITREQFWVLAKFKYPTHQINFCTEDALKCLEYRDYEVIQ